MANYDDIAKDIVVAAIQNGLIVRNTKGASDNDTANKQTAESISETFKIIRKAVAEA